MRKLFVFALAALVPACAPASDDDAVASDASEIVADKVVGNLCHLDGDTALHQQGVAYVGLCSGQVARIDLVTGTLTNLGTFTPGETLYFQQVGRDYALWTTYANAPATAATRPPTTINVWDAAFGARSFVADTMLAAEDLGTSIPKFGLFRYAGEGRVFAIWDWARTKAGVVDVRNAPALAWQTDAPSLRAIGSTWYSTVIASSDSSRMLVGNTLIDLRGATPRIVPLAFNVKPFQVFGWGGNYAPWDGKRAFVLRQPRTTSYPQLDRASYALLDLDTLVQTPLGEPAEHDALGRLRPTTASDGTLAYYTYSGGGAARATQLEILTPGATQPKTERVLPQEAVGSIVYVAPGGAWALTSQSKRQPNGSELSTLWKVDLAAPGAPAPAKIAEYGSLRVNDDGAFVTLALDASSRKTRVVRIAMDGTAAPEVALDQGLTFLTSSRVLTGACLASFDGAALTKDADGCLPAEDQKYAPEVVIGKNRFVVRRGPTSSFGLATYLF